MSDAPERIWAIEFAHGDKSWTDNPKIGKYRKEMEYVRADLYEAQAAEIERLQKWNADMVAKAASDGVLDGYREMGATLASAEKRIAELEGALREIANDDEPWLEDMVKIARAALGEKGQ